MEETAEITDLSADLSRRVDARGCGISAEGFVRLGSELIGDVRSTLMLSCSLRSLCSLEV